MFRTVSLKEHIREISGECPSDFAGVREAAKELTYSDMGRMVLAGTCAALASPFLVVDDAIQGWLRADQDASVQTTEQL